MSLLLQVLNKLGYIFNLEIVNGKAVNKSAAIAVSFDLLNVLNDNALTNEWLKGKNVKISVNKACELTMIYIDKPVASEVIVTEVADEVTSA